MEKKLTRALFLSVTILSSSVYSMDNSQVRVQPEEEVEMKWEPTISRRRPAFFVPLSQTRASLGLSTATLKPIKIENPVKTLSRYKPLVTEPVAHPLKR